MEYGDGGKGEGEGREGGGKGEAREGGGAAGGAAGRDGGCGGEAGGASGGAAGLLELEDNVELADVAKVHVERLDEEVDQLEVGLRTT